MSKVRLGHVRSRAPINFVLFWTFFISIYAIRIFLSYHSQTERRLLFWGEGLVGTARMVRLFPVKSMISINRNEICNNNEMGNGNFGSSSSYSNSNETMDQMQTIPNRFNVHMNVLILILKI